MAQQTQTATPQTSNAQMKSMPAAQTAKTNAVVQQPAGQTQPQQPMEEKPSIFKRWWFWVILVIFGLLIGAGIYFLMQ